MKSIYTETTASSGEEDRSPLFFGEWLRRRRKALDLTQEQLARRVSCSVFAIRKIEMGERRPSKQLAELLAQSIEISSENLSIFIKTARGELGVEHLVSPARQSVHNTQPAVKSISITGNLPRSLTAFIGRDPELSALGQLLRDPQCLLLTIVGSGGIGKTRLAIEAGSLYKELFPDGVWFVPLAALSSQALLVTAIADAVNFRFQDPSNPQSQLLRYLREKRALLILDNAEHLLDCVSLFAEILHACPHVKLLVTSRERLNLLSEWVFEVLGLPVPPNDRVEGFMSYSSVALFLQSARRVQMGFELQDADRCFVLKICQMMEGMPLGIELAAAWVGLLPCQEIAQEILRNLDFLTVSMRDIPERHRSLRATLDYSWKLLNAEEKLILSRLSVFHGSFTREAAEKICSANLGVLSSLRNKMLLYRTDEGFYSLHEFIRQYAELKLRENIDEEERVRDLHSSYFVRCLAEWERALKSSHQVDTFNRMAEVVDDLSRGWQRMVTSLQPENLYSNQFPMELLNRSLFSLSLFYEMRNRSLEAIPLFNTAVVYLHSMQNAFEKAEDCSAYYAVLGHITTYLGLHHYYIHEHEQTHSYLDEAIRLLEKSRSRILRAQAQVILASLHAEHGYLQASAALLEQSRQVFLGEADVWWYTLSTIHLGQRYISLDRLQESQTLFQEAFELVEPGDLRLGLTLRSNYAYVLNLKKDFARAEHLLQENLALSYQFKNFEITASILLELGRVALATERIELAMEYIQKSLRVLGEVGETKNLPMHHIFLGKCYIAQGNLVAARDQFREVIKTGQEFKNFQIVYWGLLNNSRISMLEGNTRKALGIALAMSHCPIEYIRIKEENVCLLSELQARLPEWEVEAAMKQVDSMVATDQGGEIALAYALKLDEG